MIKHQTQGGCLRLSQDVCQDMQKRKEQKVVISSDREFLDDSPATNIHEQAQINVQTVETQENLTFNDHNFQVRKRQTNVRMWSHNVTISSIPASQILAAELVPSYRVGSFTVTLRPDLCNVDLR